jgi:hypothetical protein
MAGGFKRVHLTLVEHWQPLRFWSADILVRLFVRVNAKADWNVRFDKNKLRRVPAGLHQVRFLTAWIRRKCAGPAPERLEAARYGRLPSLP